MIRAIIVEDDLMVASINRQYISLIGEIHVTATFYNGEDAWAHLQQNPADIAILDVYMPGLTGIELLQKIRAAALPVDVILVTAANDSRTLDAAMRLGVLDYLVKPFSYERFRAAIQKYMQRHEALQGGGSFSQPAIDRMLGGEQTAARMELTKGLQDKTLSKIREILKAHSGSMLACEEIAAAAGLSRVTVRRYMNYLVDAGEVVSDVDYKTGGRPSVQYGYVTTV